MERTVITVEQEECGWCVSLVGRPLQLFPMKVEAIDAATSLARVRHDRTGEPTAVRVQVGLEHVLVAIRG